MKEAKAPFKNIHYYSICFSSDPGTLAVLIPLLPNKRLNLHQQYSQCTMPPQLPLQCRRRFYTNHR